jgi:hypothetical protein
VLSGVISGDTVTLNTNGYVANFASAGVGNGIAVTVSGLTLGGASAANYTLAQPSTLTANITPALVTISSGLTANNKVYNGTTNATLSSNNVVLSGVISGDTATLNTNGYVANFASAGVGNGIAVSVSALTLAGASAANYTLAQPSTLTANITTAPLMVTANNTNRPYGAANPVFTGTIVGLANGDNITESFSCSATNTSPAGPYAIIPILIDPNGRLVNYSPITTNNGVLTVTPATVLTAPSWLGNGQFKLSFNTTAGQNYTVQYSTDLIHWTSFVELGGDGSPLTVTDFSATTTYRYYRVVSP